MAGGESFLRRNRWIFVLVAGMAVGIVLLAAVALLVLRAGSGDWGDPGKRVASPTGEFEVVTYDWSAMIDPGWTLAIQRTDGEGREWFWRSAEMPVPRSVEFVGPTTVAVTDDLGKVYRMEFDPETLEPSDRYCANTAYCTSSPWNGYTSTGP